MNILLSCMTIHSNDRDIKKWPYSNIFEVSLPVEIKNIVSMQLASIIFSRTLFYLFRKGVCPLFVSCEPYFVCYSDRALTAEEIQILYQLGQ